MILGPDGAPARTNGADYSASTLRQFATALIDRIEFTRDHGLQYDGERDLYQTLGYKRILTLQQMRARYDRGGIARRIVDAYPAATWAAPAVVREDDDDSELTEFEAAWQSVSRRLHIGSYLDRLDRAAGLGHYGILLIGVADGLALEEPIGQLREPDGVIFLRPYSELNATVDRFVEDTQDPRYGLPLLYRVKLGSPNRSRASSGAVNTGPTRRVHWSRVIHFADGLLEDDVYGTPRLRPVWNLLDDLIKVSGGTGEMFWRGGYRGMHADIPEDARLDPETKENLDTVLKEYDHKLRRWIQTEGGVTIKPLEASVSDPRGAFNVLLSLLAGTTGIPQRILIGSEMGRLASDQDRQNWSERIVERAERVAIPFALRPLIDRLMQIGALPTPRDGYRADPPELLAVSEETRARIVNLRSQAVERLGRSQDVQPHEWRPWVDLPAEPTPAPAGAASGDSE